MMLAQSLKSAFWSSSGLGYLFDLAKTSDSLSSGSCRVYVYHSVA